MTTTTPNTPANGGQILTYQERINADPDFIGVRSKEHMFDYVVAEIADLRAALAAPAISTVGRNAEADRIIGRLMSSDPEFDDCTDAANFIRALVQQRSHSLPEKLTPQMAEVLELGRKQPVHNTYLNLLAAAGAAQPVAPAAVSDELHFNAQRLRNVARLVGLETAVPQDDATLDGARGSVLGMVARKLREAGHTSEPWTDEQRANYRANRAPFYRCPTCCVKSGEAHFPGCSNADPSGIDAPLGVALEERKRGC